MEDGNRIKVAEAPLARFTAWSRDGKYLFHDSAGGLHRIPVTLEPYFQVTGPSKLIIGEELLEFDVVGDGETIFAIIRPRLDVGATQASYSVITGWMNELLEIAPAVESN